MFDDHLKMESPALHVMKPCMTSVLTYTVASYLFEYTNLGMNGFKNRDSHLLPIFFKEQFENLYLQETSSKVLKY